MEISGQSIRVQRDLRMVEPSHDDTQCRHLINLRLALINHYSSILRKSRSRMWWMPGYWLRSQLMKTSELGQNTDYIRNNNQIWNKTTIILGNLNNICIFLQVCFRSSKSGIVAIFWIQYLLKRKLLLIFAF